MGGWGFGLMGFLLGFGHDTRREESAWINAKTTGTAWAGSLYLKFPVINVDKEIKNF